MYPCVTKVCTHSTHTGEILTNPTSSMQKAQLLLLTRKRLRLCVGVQRQFKFLQRTVRNDVFDFTKMLILIEVVRAFARRPAGREAILKLPCVVRAITYGKREVQKRNQLRRDENSAKIVSKAAQSKGQVTKMSKKLRTSQARNKGLQTQLKKVIIIYFAHT